VKRRQFIDSLAAAALPLPRLVGRSSVAPPELTLILRGGRCFRGGRWEVCDIGIDGAGKLRFGADLRAAETFDAFGKVVSPGFIDILADNASNPAVTFPIFEKYKVADGVSTALQMHGGSAECAAYYRLLGAAPHAINYGISSFVMGIRNRTRSLAERRRQVERNLDEGALGVSHSLEYQPAPFDELVEYAKLARKYERPVFLHLRYSSAERELEGVDEAIRLARESGARVHIDHLHSTGGTFRMEAALSRIRAGIGEGLSITTCVYPYSYWATYLSSRRFDPGWQQRYGLTFTDLRVVGTGERLTAESFARYRTTQTLVAVPGGTMPFEKTLDLALNESFCMIGSDGGIQREPRANSHPRGAACFSTAIRYALDRRMPLETMLAKMTTLPRSVVLPAMHGRGVLEEGAAADLTVFDPATIRGNATIENPNQVASGIELVLVNGRQAYHDMQLDTRNGTAIRY
jgi:N-acyl-D-aspartate/D-glutamate deacylase